MTESKCKNCESSNNFFVCKNCEHKHARDAEFSKKMDIRLKTVQGHVEAIRKMLTEGEDCVSVLVQLMAVERAIHKVGIAILNNHMNTCIMESVEDGDTGEIIALNKLLEMYL